MNVAAIVIACAAIAVNAVNFYAQHLLGRFNDAVSRRDWAEMNRRRVQLARIGFMRGERR